MQTSRGLQWLHLQGLHSGFLALKRLILMPVFASTPWLLAIAPRGEQQEVAQHQSCGDEHGEKLFQPVHDSIAFSVSVDHPSLLLLLVGA